MENLSAFLDEKALRVNTSKNPFSADFISAPNAFTLEPNSVFA